MKLTYEQCRADREYLWSIAPAWDITGGYGEGDEFERLLHTPTKAMATKIYISQIDYWFQRGPQNGDSPGEVPWNDEKVREIAIRHGFLEDDID